jgi:hypothetical protein
MTTRSDVIAKALSYNGLEDGTGYPGPANVFEAALQRPIEYWCGDFVTAIYKMCGLPLPSMQAGESTGFSYVPDAEYVAQAKHDWTTSWEAQPGDLAIFCFDGSGVAAHVEMVTSYEDDSLETIGGDSGGSNIDGFSGQGGVHRHAWTAPAGVGNPEILGIVQVAGLVTFTADAPIGGDVNFRTLRPGMTGIDVGAAKAALAYPWKMAAGNVARKLPPVEMNDAWDDGMTEWVLRFREDHPQLGPPSAALGPDSLAVLFGALKAP